MTERVEEIKDKIARAYSHTTYAYPLEDIAYLLSVIEQQGRVVEKARRWQEARNAGRTYTDICDALEFALLALAAAEKV